MFEFYRLCFILQLDSKNGAFSMSDDPCRHSIAYIYNETVKNCLCMCLIPLVCPFCYSDYVLFIAHCQNIDGKNKLRMGKI